MIDSFGTVHCGQSKDEAAATKHVTWVNDKASRHFCYSDCLLKYSQNYISLFKDNQLDIVKKTL